MTLESSIDCNLDHHDSWVRRTVFHTVSEAPNVPNRQIRVIDGVVRQGVSRFLEQCDNMMKHAARYSDADAEPRQRIGVGVYVFRRPCDGRDHTGT